ncbi:MAG: GrpB family protein [Spirochaetales bacterium]|nr:GrpB family protein [Spirochaetales bacterium]
MTKEELGKLYPIIVKPYNPGLWDRIYFRNSLNQNENYRKEYEKLKQSLAQKYKYDREAYTNLKADFIMKVTNEATKHELSK